MLAPTYRDHIDPVRPHHVGYRILEAALQLGTSMGGGTNPQRRARSSSACSRHWLSRCCSWMRQEESLEAAGCRDADPA